MKKSALLLTLLCLCSFLEATVKGKVDLGPAIVDMKAYQEKSLVRKKHLKGVKGNGSFVFKEDNCWYNGLFLQPDVVYIRGGDRYLTASFSLGYFLPLSYLHQALSSFYLSPRLGFGLGIADFDLTQAPLPMVPDGTGPAGFSPGVVKATRKDLFHSFSPGIDLTFYPTQKLMLTLSGNYKFVHTRTKNTPKETVNTATGFVFPTTTPSYYQAASHGWNWGVQVDYYLTDNWSLGLGYAQDVSRFKEKFSSKNQGYRLHGAYTF